jgi:replicative DNA helicase
MPEERLPPNNIEAEEAVLGSLLLDPTCIVQIADFLHVGDFYREKNNWVYEADVALYDRHDVIDVVTLCDELERRGRLTDVGGPAYITSLMNAVPTAAHVEYYAHIVERCATLRRLITAGSEIVRLGYAEDADVPTALDKAEQLVFSVAQRRMGRDFITLRDALSDFVDQLDTLHAQRGRLLGLSTGFHDLDELLGGLHNSDLIIVAGRPSAGKTSFATSLAQHIAVHERKPVVLFSLEMSSEQLVQRLLCSEANVDSQRLRAGYMDDAEWQRVTEAIGVLSEAPVYIDDSANISAMELRTKARRLKAQYDISAVFIDYLQLMQGSGRENRVQEVSEISRSLKGLARELNVPVIALSQLSRAVESRSPHTPILSDLRESGSIEQDADVVMFVHREEMYDRNTEKKNIADIIVAKHRNGPVGQVPLRWFAAQTRFADLVAQPVETEYEEDI